MYARISVILLSILIAFPGRAKLLDHAKETGESTFDSTGWTILAVGALGAAAMWNLDGKASEEWERHRPNVPRPLLDAADYVGTGIPTLAIIGAQFFFDRNMAWSHLEGVLLATAVTALLKNAVGRERPDGSDDHSFPSGHTTVAFATATNIHYWLGWKWGVPAYALATFVGFERFHDSKHWVSDILAGATIGVLFGRGSANKWMKGRIAPMFVEGGFGLKWVYEF